MDEVWPLLWMIAVVGVVVPTKEEDGTNAALVATSRDANNTFWYL